MRVWKLAALGVALAGAFSVFARADYSIPIPQTGPTSTVLSFVCQVTKQCPVHVQIDSSGVEKGTLANPVNNKSVLIDGGGTEKGTTSNPVTVNGAAANNVDNVAPVSGGLTPSLAYQMTWDGSAWQRAMSFRGGVFGTPGVDVFSVQGGPGMVPVAVTGAFFQATQPISAAALPLPSGAATAALQGSPGRAVSSGSKPVVPTPAPLTWHLIAAGTTNATPVKGSPATLFSCQLGNNSATIGYLKIYNKATAPTVGTDVPVKTLIIPGPTTGGGSNISFGPGGLTLGTGFAAAVTNGIADTDAVAVAAATFAINCDYE